MLRLKIKELPAKINAFSLIESLLALAITSLIFLVLARFYTNLTQQNFEFEERLRLQKESHQLLSYIQLHSQHMGYQGANRTESNFAFFQQNGVHYQLDNQYLSFFYDLNDDGCVGERKKSSCVKVVKEPTKEIFAFRLKNQEIQIYSANTLPACAETACLTALKDATSGWEKLTTTQDFYVKKLDFSWLADGKLLKLELELQSQKIPRVKYVETMYSYLLNTE